MNAPRPVLDVRGIDKHFGALHVSRDIDLTLMPGARHALIGPNGAGKTTCVNLITGAVPVDRGQILLDGEPITQLDLAARARRGLSRTFQINQLFRELTVLENVVMPIIERLGRGHRFWQPVGRQSDAVDEALELLAAFELDDVALTPVRELAYGRQRLVEIVIALGRRPRVLLLDEPAAGVASSETRLILDAIDRLPADTAVLIIDHDMDIIFRVATRISVLVAGAVLAEGTPDEIANDRRVREVYLGQE
ncbi:MAG: ABC transporter ATP-binding protein [Burkholderiaceae bacterium]